jgi:hypothetical protein
VNGFPSRMPSRGSDQRFEGFRVNVESGPRLPVFPAKWALEDPRRRPARAVLCNLFSGWNGPAAPRRVTARFLERNSWK